MIWVKVSCFRGKNEQLKLPPVKLRPNISSSGGNNDFGVVVLVILSFEGSISVIEVPTEASACML